MFIYYFANVNRAFDDADRSFVRQTLDDWAEESYREGEQLRARLTAGGGIQFAKEVELRADAPMHGSRHTTIPITWRATGTPGLFPRLDADLVLAPIGPHTSQVSLRGNYEPPLGPVGKVFDRAIFHRIAEASVKAFVDRLAASLERAGAEV